MAASTGVRDGDDRVNVPCCVSHSLRALSRDEWSRRTMGQARATRTSGQCQSRLIDWLGWQSYVCVPCAMTEMCWVSWHNAKRRATRTRTRVLTATTAEDLCGPPKVLGLD